MPLFVSSLDSSSVFIVNSKILCDAVHSEEEWKETHSVVLDVIHSTEVDWFLLFSSLLLPFSSYIHTVSVMFAHVAGMGFTLVIAGLYTSGKSLVCCSSACIDWASVKETKRSEVKEKMVRINPRRRRKLSYLFWKEILKRREKKRVVKC